MIYYPWPGKISPYTDMMKKDTEDWYDNAYTFFVWKQEKNTNVKCCIWLLQE